MIRFAGLAAGDVLTSGPVLLTGDGIRRFATEFDPQRFHVDPEQAAASMFGGLIGSGWHLAALTMRLLLEALPAPSELVGTEALLEWPTPSRPGDELRVTATVESVEPSASRPDRARVRFVCETRNQDGEVRQRLRATVLVLDRADG